MGGVAYEDTDLISRAGVSNEPYGSSTQQYLIIFLKLC